MKIAEGTIAEIKDKLRDILASYVHFGTGRQQYAQCPLPTHAERTPSFSYSKKRNMWKCFGCGAGGDTIMFIRLMHPEKTFAEAVKIACNILGIEVQHEGSATAYTPQSRNETTPAPIDYLDLSILTSKVSATKAQNLNDNPLLAGLVDIFDAEVVRTVIDRYAITFEGEWIEFPQIDAEKKYRTGKAIKYLADGHRCKDSKPRWAHTGLTDSFRQCITGMHLLKFFPDKQVAIVEGASTMLFMACLSLAAEKYSIKELHVFTAYVWLSTGGVGGVNLGHHENASVLSGRRVVLYPDTGAYESWLKYAHALKLKGIEVVTSQMMEKAYLSGRIGRNTDLRDYFSKNAGSIKQLTKNQFNLRGMVENLERHFVKGDIEKCETLADEYERMRESFNVPIEDYLSAITMYAPQLHKYVTH